VIQVQVRVPDEAVAQVKRLARERKTTEADVWRGVVERGLNYETSNSALIETIAKSLIENLCITRRLAAETDESINTKGRADAKRLLQELGIL
jgi:hypothetical protein